MNKGYKWSSSARRTEDQEWCERCISKTSVDFKSLVSELSGGNDGKLEELGSTYRDAECVLHGSVHTSYDALCALVSTRFDNVLATVGPAPGQEPNEVEIRPGVKEVNLDGVDKVVHVDVWDADTGSKSKSKSVAKDVAEFVKELFPVETRVSRYDDKYTVSAVDYDK